MPITFFCPSGHPLRAANKHTGRQVSCPVCGQRTIVPSRSDRVSHADSSGLAAEVSRGGGSGKDQPPQPPPLPAETSGARTGQPSLAAEPNQDEDHQQPFPPPLRNQQALQLSRNRRRSWIAQHRWFPQPSQRLTSGAYRPDRGKVQTVRWLAVLLGLLVIFSAWPALAHLDLQLAPGWARAVLLLASLQAIYVVWMAVTPDWSTVRVVMMVFAAVSALYGMATAIAIATPLDSPLPLGMQDFRTSAPRWCGAILLLMALATYLCGRISFQWQRSWRWQTADRGER